MALLQTAVQGETGDTDVRTWDQAATAIDDVIGEGADARLRTAFTALTASSGTAAPAAVPDDAFMSPCESAFGVELS